MSEEEGEEQYAREHTVPFVEAEGQPGLEYWAGPGGHFQDWSTVKFKTQVADTGAQALSLATKYVSEQGIQSSGIVASAEDLTQFVAMWAAAAFVNTNETRRQRGKEPFKSVPAVYNALSQGQELWQASHLALACLASGYFPIILGPGKVVDCSFSLPPVMDALVDMSSNLDHLALVFYWTHRKTVTTKPPQGQVISYKHFQPLIDPNQPTVKLFELPDEILNQLQQCRSKMSRHRFAFVCKERVEGKATDFECDGQERAAQQGQFKFVRMIARQTHETLAVTLPKEGFGPPKSLLRSANVNMLNSIILDQVQAPVFEIRDLIIHGDRELVRTIRIANNEALKTEDDRDVIKALGFKLEGSVWIRPVRGTNDFPPTHLVLPWREYHELDLLPDLPSV
jgi:hypothetical protein